VTADSTVGEQLINRVHALPTPGARLVTGVAATLVDTQHALASRLPWVGAIIAATMFVLLFLFTGSLIVPLKAMVLAALSLTASFGAVVWVFQYGHLRGLVGGFNLTGQLETTTPVLMFYIAYGLPWTTRYSCCRVFARSTCARRIIPVRSPGA
jgi:putative drug exporter of the RND superfamily